MQNKIFKDTKAAMKAEAEQVIILPYFAHTELYRTTATWQNARPNHLKVKHLTFLNPTSFIKVSSYPFSHSASKCLETDVY